MVLRGYGHSFDAPYAKMRSVGRGFQECDLLGDANTIAWVKTGEQVPNTPAGYRQLMDKCRSVGYHTGASGNRFIGVPVWQAFFKQHLQ